MLSIMVLYFLCVFLLDDPDSGHKGRLSNAGTPNQCRSYRIRVSIRSCNWIDSRL